jgi:hypothetical protein
MRDLNDQLRSYIDGLARPISMSETTTRRVARRPVAFAAVLAGAAVVLIPALVIVGIRWWPGGGNVAEPSTMPPATTTTTLPETTTTTTTIPTAVVVPNVVGLTEEQARQMLAEVGLELEVVEVRFRRSSAGIVLAQGPEPNETAAPSSKVLVDISAIPACIDWQPDAPTPANGEMTITLFFQCADDTDIPDISTPTTRMVAQTDAVIEATLAALLAGPTDAERAAGIESFFSAESANALDSVELGGHHLIVDFNDAIIINNASTTTGGTYFMAELQANLFQFPVVDTIEFRLNGSCLAFGDYMEIGECAVWTRTDWEQRISDWDGQRTEAALDRIVTPPGEYMPYADLLGQLVVTREVNGSEYLMLASDPETAWTGYSQTGAWPVSGDTWALAVPGAAGDDLWLVGAVDAESGGQMIARVDAIFRLPASDQRVVSGAAQCTVNGHQDSTVVVAIGKSDDAGTTTPLHAWRIDPATATIDEIPTDGLDCSSAG